MIYDSTWDYLEHKTDALTKTISFQGRLKKVDGDVERYLDKFINDYETKPDYFVRYYVELKTTKASFGLMIAGGVFLLIGVIMIILGFVNDKKDKRMEAETEQFYSSTPWAGGFSLVLDNQELDRMSASRQPVAPRKPSYDVTNATPAAPVSADPVMKPAVPDVPASAETESENETQKPAQDSDNNDIFVL